MAQVKVVRRDKDDNYELNELLESAHGRIQEAQAQVTYSAYPEINADVIKKLKQIEHNIFDLLIVLEENKIYKPVKC